MRAGVPDTYKSWCRSSALCGKETRTEWRVTWRVDVVFAH